MDKLSILIPAYNEEGTIKELIDKVKKVDLSKFNLEKEIIIIDDGSKDKTIEIVSSLPDVKLIKHSKNAGKGMAIRTGIKYVTGKYVVIQDADLEYDPEDYKILIAEALKNDADVVYGSRRLRKDNPKHSGLSFYLGGVGLTWLTNLLYPHLKITDEPTCYKFFKTKLIKSIPLRCKRFEFCPEITAKVAKRKIKIYEVPISYYPRSIKEGKKISWRDGIEAIWTLIKYRFVD
jgi:dolichol-phosphate mannosyltransferase